MAGSYPDAPSHRIPYDADGSVVWGATGIGASAGFGGSASAFTAFQLPVTEFSSTTKAELNDEDSVSILDRGGPGDPDSGVAWVWPEKRDIYGFFGHVLSDDQTHIRELDYSTNTKNGISGDFTVILTSGDIQQPEGGDQFWTVDQSYREYINSFTSTGVRSVRARMRYGKNVGDAVDQAHVRAFHWYGDIADAANPDRIIYVDDATGLSYDELQDWGDIPRGSVHDKEIRLLNNSASLSASSNVITFESLTGDSHTWYTIRDNSSTSLSFSTELTINGPITAGSRYPASTSLTLRLTVADDEDLGPHSARMKLFTNTWA